MRFYRLLLFLYPVSFRGEYSSELCAAFEREHRDAGVFSTLATILAAIADVVPNAIAVHWDILRQDLRYMLRAIRQSPGFAITAVLVVALGVGANTAAFSVADFVLIRPLPFQRPDRLMKLWEKTPGYGEMELSPGNYRDWKVSTNSFASMAAYTDLEVNLTGTGEPLRLNRGLVTSDLFSVLGARPLIGRSFTAADTVAGQSVILSYELWQTQFGADPRILGTRIDLDGAPYTIVGVMPSSFHFPTRHIALWTTMAFDADAFADRANNYLDVVGRLRDGATLEGARGEADVIFARLRREFAKDNENTAANIRPMANDLSVRSRLLLLALCGAALCILLLACANLANLLLARALSREREIAVRAALGAGRERLVRQLATESVVLAIVGGAVGLLVAVAAVPGLARLVPDNLPIGQAPSLNVRVALFAAVTIGMTGFGFGIVPALRSGGARGLAALRDGTRAGGGRRQRVRGMLVAIEVMASVVLLVSSGLLMRAMWRLQSQQTGFSAGDVLTLRTALPMPRYADPLARRPFFTRVLTEIRALPGVTSAAYVTGLPMVMKGGIWAITVNGHESIRADAANNASLRFVTPQFFATLRIPIGKGRDVAETDRADHPFIAVVSESFAKRYWPAENPIGKHFQVAMHDREVVGVVGDIRVRGLEQRSEPQLYLPYEQVDSGSLVFYTPKDLVVRSSSPPATLLPQIRRIVRAADPSQPISDVRTMEEIVANETTSRLGQLRVLGMLAAIALLLAAVGIHGLLSFTVSRRTQEIGVRVALGAESRQIMNMVIREGLLLSLAGVVPGLAIAYAAGRGMEALLVGVRPNDPIALTVAIAATCLTALLGCARPAMRASRIDPNEALRAE
ncbi:MAG TPA: ABC transporter permease [Gemmatimonadaceae bacterium]